MRIGILVNKDKNLADIIGITNAAVKKGHEVELFAMDAGTKLLEKDEFKNLRNIQGVFMGFCDYSSKNVGANTDNMPEEIKRADQWHNSKMHNNADKMIIL